MAHTKKLLTFSIIVAVIAGCAGTGTLTGALYPPQSGTINLTANNPPAGVTSVEFDLDGKPVPNGAKVPVTTPQGTPEAVLPFDTTLFANGIHTLQATGNGSGGPIVLFTNTIIIVNGANPSTAPSVTPVPSASATIQPSPSATPARCATGTPNASGVCPTSTASSATGTGSAF
jgi:hypothetical protein